jgi:hypothetical protein
MELNESGKRYTGGCLCGQLRYEAEGEPLYAGLCYCVDCQKSSGSGFVPFMGFASSAVRFSGATRKFTSKAARGGDAVRNFCPVCGSLVFGPGNTLTPHTITSAGLGTVRAGHPSPRAANSGAAHSASRRMLILERQASLSIYGSGRPDFRQYIDPER